MHQTLTYQPCLLLPLQLLNEGIHSGFLLLPLLYLFIQLHLSLTLNVFLNCTQWLTEIVLIPLDNNLEFADSLPLLCD